MFVLYAGMRIVIDCVELNKGKTRGRGEVNRLEGKKYRGLKAFFIACPFFD